MQDPAAPRTGVVVYCSRCYVFQVGRSTLAVPFPYIHVIICFSESVLIAAISSGSLRQLLVGKIPALGLGLFRLCIRIRFVFHQCFKFCHSETPFGFRRRRILRSCRLCETGNCSYTVIITEASAQKIYTLKIFSVQVPMWRRCHSANLAASSRFSHAFSAFLEFQGTVTLSCSPQ